MEAAGQAEYSSILMDCEMPVMDSYRATGEIRRQEDSSRHTPIVALTGMARDSDRERCLAAGMDGYVAKPMRLAELLAALERFARPKRFPPNGFEQPALENSILASFTLDALAEILPTVFETSPGRLVRLQEALRGDSWLGRRTCSAARPRCWVPLSAPRSAASSSGSVGPARLSQRAPC